MYLQYVAKDDRGGAGLSPRSFVEKHVSLCAQDVLFIDFLAEFVIDVNPSMKAKSMDIVRQISSSKRREVACQCFVSTATTALEPKQPGGGERERRRERERC